MSIPGAISGDLEALHRSDQRAVRTVDSLTDEQWAGASVLPGWSRAHVVAHLALNGEGFGGALEALGEGEVRPIYPSEAARDQGIEQLAQAPYDEIRERFFAAVQHFRNVCDELTEQHWAGTVLRLPEGPEWPAAGMVGARRREVEIHHADLGLAYGPADWPDEFTTSLLNRAAAAQPFTVTATDLDLTWGTGTPAVAGAGSALAWWLIGRGTADGLASDGTLPDPSPW